MPNLRIIYAFVFCISFSLNVFGGSMSVSQPFYKAYFECDGVVFSLVVNGAEIYYGDSGNPNKLEIPINQFVRTGDNKFELQLHTYEENNKLSLRDNAYIRVEYRLYTKPESFVVLSEISYDASKEGVGREFGNSSKKEVYSLQDSQLVINPKGDYSVSKLHHIIDSKNYDFNYLYHIVSMVTPFPEWEFLKAPNIPDIGQYKSIEQLKSQFISGPFGTIQQIHTALSAKKVDEILPLFSERNREMDIAFYYQPGTYEKMLKEAILAEFKNGMVLDSIDINYAQPIVSPGSNLMQLGASPLISFSSDDESVFSSYDIFFRKDGDNWIISR